ncbi:hypothetical protein FB451DRAFT_1260846 [Mycena latifolia]|nr:hypothetical protein FB451DRAFT_1260846 [Mycena latifolia]
MSHPPHVRLELMPRIFALTLALITTSSCLDSIAHASLFKLKSRAHVSSNPELMSRSISRAHASLFALKFNTPS